MEITVMYERKEERIMSKKTPVLHGSQMGWVGEEFDCIREAFFPGWDSKYEWRIGWMSDCPVIYGCSCLGENMQLIPNVFREERFLDGRQTCERLPHKKFYAYCYIDSQVILFNDEDNPWWDDFGLPFVQALIVHEIAHASHVFEESPHGKSWQKKMEGAASLAKRVGKPLLAWILEIDLTIAILNEGSGEGVEDLEGDYWAMNDWAECQYNEMEYQKEANKWKELISNSERLSDRPETV